MPCSSRAFALVCCLLIATASAAQTFETGDVIVSGAALGTVPLTYTYKVLWFSGSGQFKGILYTQPNTTTAVYLAHSTGPTILFTEQGRIRRLAADGTRSGPLAGGFLEPRDFTFARNGRIFATNSDWILEYTADLQLVRFIDLEGVILGIDLAPDQCTLYHTSNIGVVNRYDVCRNIPLAPFTGMEPSESYGDLRLIPSGLLHTRSGVIVRRDASANVVQTYPTSGIFALDPDRVSFWTAIGGTSIQKVDIATGAVRVGPFPVGNDLIFITSIAVIGEPWLALSDPAPDVPLLTPRALAVLTTLLGLLAVLALRQRV